jgi:hypothetical protein
MMSASVTYFLLFFVSLSLRLSGGSVSGCSFLASG